MIKVLEPVQDIHLALMPQLWVEELNPTGNLVISANLSELSAKKKSRVISSSS